MPTNRMKTAMARLASRLVSRTSRTVTYSTPDGSVTLSAVLGDKLLSLTDEYGAVRLERTDKDFLIRPDDLVVNGARVTPARGHTVSYDDEDSGSTLTYAVLPYAGEPTYRDRMLGEMLRVHTKLVGEVSTPALLDELGAPLLDELGEPLLGEG